MENSNQPYKQKTLGNKEGTLAQHFFIKAYEDYLSARLLILNNKLQQGCILANTAIEKYFKGMITLINEPVPKHHDISASKFRNTLNNKYPKIAEKINFEFINFLAKSYKLRYFDDLEANFNILIIKMKTLTELDFLVSIIEESFLIVRPSLGVRDNRYRQDKEDENSLLRIHNYKLNNQEKKTVIEQPDMVYEFRKVFNGEIFEIFYVTDQIIDDNKFDYEAFKPVKENPNQSFSTVFLPISSTN